MLRLTRAAPFVAVHAPIQLRYCNIRIRDGQLLSGSVNNVSGYAVGSTTMLVTFGAGVAVVTGNTFTIGGDPAPNQASQTFTSTFGIYKITAHTESSGSTTSITFTPGLDQAAVNGAIVTVGPHALIIKVGDGNMTFNEKRNIIYVRDRGILDTVRYGDDEPIEVKFEFIWEFLQGVSGSGTPTIEDALKQRGEASAWVTSSSDTCEPYAVDIEVEYVPPCPGTQREIWLFKDFRWEELSHDLKQAQVSITGKCNVHEIIDTRAA